MAAVYGGYKVRQPDTGEVYYSSVINGRIVREYRRPPKQDQIDRLSEQVNILQKQNDDILHILKNTPHFIEKECASCNVITQHIVCKSVSIGGSFNVCLECIHMKRLYKEAHSDFEKRIADQQNCTSL